MCWLEDSVCDYWPSLDSTLIFRLVSEGEAMTAAMPVAPVSAAPRAPAAASAHATPSTATPAPRKLFGVSGFVR